MIIPHFFVSDELFIKKREQWNTGVDFMYKKETKFKKSVHSHTLEAHSIDHHEEISEDFFPTILDPEGTLADCYIMHINEEMKKSKEN